ncbi:MAG: Asp-tRNA(Asn)/Glu-tRNA(Gln) amidotransferase subunit GatA [bacterium]
MELYELTALEMSRRLESGEATSLELVESVLKRIDSVEPRIRAFLHLDREKALEEARQADLRRRRGEGVTPMTGVPVAIKDIICVQGLPNTCGSRILENFIPPYDATVIVRLREAGAVILGKTNMDEFAMGSSTENSAYGPTYNPWDLERVPGGSSGGSAAAVAAGEAPLALGTDTGGSVRQPAAFCGITGLKPTYGLVSRYGVVAYASSLDQVGPLAGSVRDAAFLLNVIAGHDPKDSTSAQLEKPDYLNLEESSVRNLKIGFPREFYGEGLDPAIKEALLAVGSFLEKEGAHLVDVSFPNIEYALPAYYIIAPSEASSNLARYDGSRYGHRNFEAQDIMTMFKKSRQEGFGAEVKRRIMIGTYALSSGYYEAYYLKAQKARTILKNDYDAAFKECDVLLTPTTPCLPFKIGEKTDDPLQMYLCDIYTISVNLAGLPGLVFPCGFHGHLPIGAQLIGPAFSEKTLLGLGAFYQKRTEHHLRRPALASAGG